jgi:superfamily II DNA or RNA helicase
VKELWPHQTRAIDLLRGSLVQGKRRPILQLATGAGKTVIAAAIFRMAREKNPGVRLLFVVDAISLIDQTVKAFYAEGLHSIGVIQADHMMQDWSKPIQIASVQTLQRRQMFNADIVIVDECHRQNRWLHEVMASADWADVPFIGLSASPWSRGLGNVYDDLLIPVTMKELIDAGFLSPFRVFAAAHPDLAGVATVRGDFHEAQLSAAMSEGGLIADIVQTWKKMGEGRSTFVFCVDRAHAKKVQQRFLDNGIGCGYIDAYTEPHDRNEIRRKLESGEIKVVANVACLTTGVDWPFVSCVVLARPTKSEMLFVQMIGRGLRDHPGKSDCLILDHADNTLRLGFVTDIHHGELCTAKKGERSKIEAKAVLPKECPSCSFLKPPKVHECPSCGFKPERRSDLEEADGELVEVNPSAIKLSRDEKQRWYSSLLGIARDRGRSNGWVAHTYKRKFGVWPRGLSEFPIPAAGDVIGYVRHCDIAFSKRKQVA